MTIDQLDALIRLAHNSQPDDFATVTLPNLTALAEGELWALAGMLLDVDLGLARFACSYAAHTRRQGEKRIDPISYWKMHEEIDAEIETIIAKVEAGVDLETALAEDAAERAPPIRSQQYQELKRFCAPDDDHRRYMLREPWSHDGFSYATNGHILVKVPRLPDVPERDDAPNPPTAALAAAAGQETSPLPLIVFSDPPLTVCSDCAGCSRCQEDCEECGGTGKVPARMSVALGGAIFDAAYIALITVLEGVEFSVAPPPGDTPARFIFAGGEGVVMPLRKQEPHHVVVEERIDPVTSN